MKKILSALLCLSLLMLASACQTEAAEYQKYSTSFFGTFDTIIQIVGYAKDQATFNRITGEVEARFQRLHQIYDIYHAYDGVHNIYSVNQKAASGPVPAEPELIDLLLFCRQQQPLTKGTVNVALGPVLSLWHGFREQAERDPGRAIPPSEEALLEAVQHIDFDAVIIDEAQGTVFFSDPAMRLDLGSVAKGYATELVAQWLLSSEMPSFVLNAGGNVRAGEKPLDGRESWTVAVQKPDGFSYMFSASDSDLLDKLHVTGMSVVTSGDYQRYVLVDGERFHHIISPFTLKPAEGMRAVTVLCEDSGLADILSTAFFILPYEEGRALAETLAVDVLWVFPDGRVEMTDGAAQVAESQMAG